MGTIIEALGAVSPELMLAYLRAEDPEVQREVVRAAANVARDRLLALEGVREAIGPHLEELGKLESAWDYLSRALEGGGE